MKAHFLSDKSHVRTFKAADFDGIVILLGDGNDAAEIDKKITKPVLMDGAAGDDLLVGGPGKDTLDGEAGNNTLIDWSGKYWDCHVPGNGTCHQAKVIPCAIWVKDFVIHLAGDSGIYNPNGGIKIVLLR